MGMPPVPEGGGRIAEGGERKVESGERIAEGGGGDLIYPVGAISNRDPSCPYFSYKNEIRKTSAT